MSNRSTSKNDYHAGAYDDERAMRDQRFDQRRSDVVLLESREKRRKREERREKLSELTNVVLSAVGGGVGFIAHGPPGAIWGFAISWIVLNTIKESREKEQLERDIRDAKTLEPWEWERPSMLGDDWFKCPECGHVMAYSGDRRENNPCSECGSEMVLKATRRPAEKQDSSWVEI